jgi:hypothetical protein
MNNTRRLRTVFVSLIVLANLLGACQPAPAESPPQDFQIRLERSPCFGTCPVYAVAVSADGQVVYEGLDFVAVEGQQTVSISEAEVRALYAAVTSGEFFDLEDGYTYPATDLPTATTTVTMDGRKMTVVRYGGGCGSDLDTAPPELCEIEALMEAIPISNGWVSDN